MEDKECVTEDDFAKYEELRQWGIVNMLSPQVCGLAGIDKETHLAIIEHYKELCAKWPHIRSLALLPRKGAVMHTLNCGCEYHGCEYHEGDVQDHLVFCKLHRAAPKLLGALERILAELQGVGDTEVSIAFAEAIIDAKTVIAGAKGE